MKRFEQIKEDFQNTLNKLEQAVQEARSDLEIDGAIQRFEFTFELFWKTYRIYLELQGISTNSPRGVLKELLHMKLISDEKLWLTMLEDRNLSSHTYSLSTSREIFGRIKTRYLTAITETIGRVSDRSVNP